MKIKRFVVIAALIAVLPAVAFAQTSYPEEVLERYWQCMERHDLKAVQDLLWYHHNVERIDASIYGLPRDDFDDRSLLTIDERLTYRQSRADRLANDPKDVAMAITGPVQYPHHLRAALDHNYEVSGERMDCSQILEDAGVDAPPTEDMGDGWVSDLNLTSFDNFDRGEVDLVIDYANPNRIMASSCPSGGTGAPDESSNFIAYTNDWGQNWTATAVGNNSGSTWECDPVSYYQRSTGNVYHSKIGCSNGMCSSTYTMMRYSTNNGASWSDCTRPDSNGSEDRQWHVVDNTPSSPCYGNIYMTWHNSNQEKVVRSTSNCTSWSGLTNLTGTYSAITPDINVAADGHAYVVWQNYGDATFKIAGSNDCGASWASPSAKTVKTRLGDWKNNIPAQCVRGISTLPNVDVDRCPSSDFYGRLYMTMFDFDQSGCGSGPGCTDWTDSCDYDVYFTYSDNNGGSFATPVNITRDVLGHGDRVDSFMGYMRVDESDGAIYVAYHRTRLNPGALADRQKTNYFVARSTDGGSTWAEYQASTLEGDERLSGASTFERGDYNRIDVFEGVIYPVWIDRRNTTGAEEIITRKICTEPTHMVERGSSPSSPPTTVTDAGGGLVNISWTAPDAHWGDGGEDTSQRFYQLYVDGSLAQDNILWTATSISNYDPGDCNSHTYFIRAINQCDISKDYATNNHAATGCCPNNPSSVDVTPNGPLTLCQGSGQVLSVSTTGGSGLSYQWERDGSPISGATSTTYTANDTGTHTYNCEVTGNTCTSGVRDPSSVQITWQYEPTFGGILSVTNPGSATCTLDLSWNAASSVCGGPFTYSIYRSELSGFTPGVANRIASGVSGTTHADADGLVSGTTYYYVVRAVDTSNSAEDSNTVELSGAATGSATTVFDDDFEGGNLGWAFTTGTPAASTGDFIIGDPVGTVSNYGDPAQPEDDHTVNPGVNCMYTAANPAAGAGTDDIDGGEVITTSPAFDLSSYDSVNLSLWRWFFNEDDDTASGNNDYYRLEVSDNNGSSWTTLEYLDETVTTAGTWTNVTFNLEDYVSLTSTIRVRVRGADDPTVGDIVEIAIDDVLITGYNACTTGSSCTDPGAPTITGITDDDNCAQDGVTVNFSGGTGATSHDLYVDGSLEVVGFTSGDAYDPGDSGSHSYVVRAIDQSCFTDSSSQSFSDIDNGPGTPVLLSITDADGCAQSGINVNYTAAPAADRHDLVRNGLVVVTGYVSGALYNPGGTGSYTYLVRAVRSSCTVDSASQAFADAANPPGAPVITGITDANSCALDGIHLNFTAGTGAASHDLLRDGGVVVTGYTSGALYNPGDGNPHTYQVRAVAGATCYTDSTGQAFTDQAFPMSYAGLATATDRDACDDTGVVVTWSAPGSWNDGGFGSRGFRVYRGGADVSGLLAEGTNTFVDTGGTNGTPYNYSVAAVNGYGCSADGGVTISATDVVGTAPTFGDLQSLSQLPGDICGQRLEWDAATSGCATGPAITYNVYRSESAGFTPDPATNLLSSCVADLYYEDTTCAAGTTYYYIVRAEDSSAGHGGPCNDGFEDSNTTELSGAVGGGAPTTVVLLDDDYEGSPTPSDHDWISTDLDGDASHEWVISTANPHNGANSGHFGSAGNYANDQDDRLVAGCDGVIGNCAGGMNGISIPGTAATVTLTYWQWYDFEARFDRRDGAFLEYSTTSSSAGFAAIPDTDPGTGPYISSINYNDTTSGVSCLPGSTPTGQEIWSNAATTWAQITVDLSDLAGQTIWLGFRGFSNCFRDDPGWYIDEVHIEADIPGGGICDSAPNPVQHLTATASAGEVKVEWQNPSAGSYGYTRVCSSTSGYPTDPLTCSVVVNDTGMPGQYDSEVVGSLSNGTTYYYSAWVYDGTSEYSARQTVAARPFDNSDKVKWEYCSGATALTPAGIMPGAVGNGAAFAVSNDRVFHSMNPPDMADVITDSDGGDWPRTSRYSWMPMGMNGPAQSRPPVLSTTIVPGADLVSFLGSEDGHAYAVNAETGAVLWQSPVQLGNMLTASPTGVMTQYLHNYDLLFVGTRDAGSNNVMYGLNPIDGVVRWSYNNGGGGNGIGIISSTAWADGSNDRLYFTSRENATGSANTVWCLNFTDGGATLAWARALGDVDARVYLWDGALYVGTNSGVIYSLDPVTGATNWSYATTDGAVKEFVLPEFTSLPRKLFFSTTNTVWSIVDQGTTVSDASGDGAWTHSAVSGPTVPLVRPGTTELYVGSTNGSLYQINATDGSSVISVTLGTGSAAAGSPTVDVVNNVMYAGTETGAVYAVLLPLN